MKRSAQEIITEIVSHIVNNGGDYKDWYIGIASNIKEFLAENEIKSKKSKTIYYQSKSTVTAKLAAQTLIEQYEVNGGDDKLANQGNYVYAYRNVSENRNNQNGDQTIDRKNVEKRKHARVDIFFPIFYNCFDDDNNITGQNMAVALDISQGGMLLETVEPIDTNYVNLNCVSVHGKIFEIKGKVVHSKKDDHGKIIVGISFQGKLFANAKFAQEVIRAFFYKKQDYTRKGSANISAVSIL